MVITKPCYVDFSAAGGTTQYRLALPEGLRCSNSPVSNGMGKVLGYFLDEFPLILFPKGSLIRHDAQKYGIILDSNQVKVVEEE